MKHTIDCAPHGIMQHCAPHGIMQHGYQVIVENWATCLKSLDYICIKFKSNWYYYLKNYYHFTENYTFLSHYCTHVNWPYTNICCTMLEVEEIIVLTKILLQNNKQYSIHDVWSIIITYECIDHCSKCKVSGVYPLNMFSFWIFSFYINVVRSCGYFSPSLRFQLKLQSTSICLSLTGEPHNLVQIQQKWRSQHDMVILGTYIF